jgi:hypothetical protein
MTVSLAPIWLHYSGFQAAYQMPHTCLHDTVIADSSGSSIPASRGYSNKKHRQQGDLISLPFFLKKKRKEG